MRLFGDVRPGDRAAVVPLKPPGAPVTKCDDAARDYAVVRRVKTASTEGLFATVKVGADAENASHSKHSAALSSLGLDLSCRSVLDPSLLWTTSKREGRQTRQIDAYSSL